MSKFLKVPILDSSGLEYLKKLFPAHGDEPVFNDRNAYFEIIEQPEHLLVLATTARGDYCDIWTIQDLSNSDEDFKTIVEYDGVNLNILQPATSTIQEKREFFRPDVDVANLISGTKSTSKDPEVSGNVRELLPKPVVDRDRVGRSIANNSFFTPRRVNSYMPVAVSALALLGLIALTANATIFAVILFLSAIVGAYYCTDGDNNYSSNRP